MAIDRQNSPYRRGNRYDQLPIPMVTEHCIPVDAGAVQFVVESRKLTNEIIDTAFRGGVDAGIPFDDFGATLHVCGTADGLEHLRFDCFDKEPHYHYIEQANGANTVVRIDELAVGDPIEFSLACAEHHLPDMLRHCGVVDLAAEVAGQPDKVSAAIAEVRELMAKARYPVASRVPAHPRLSVNSISSYLQPLTADIALWRDLGIEHVALILPKIEEVGWDAAGDMVTRAGLRVSTIFGPTYRPLDADRDLGWWDADQAGTVRTVEFAASIGAASVYVCTGAAPTLTWDEAADAFGELVAPAVVRSAELGVPLLVEPTNPLRADVSFVFWQRDAMDLARRADTLVMLDFQSCWYERGLEQVVRENIDMVGVAQISDFVIGTTETGNRAVPGDGDIPLERLVAMTLDAGYEGAFDLEVMGPRVEEEGYRSAVRRAVERASELLDRLGA